MTFVSKSSTINDFYYACRNGLIDKVREQLPNMTLEEIDQIQGNGSTPLHAACYYGHTEIVKLLLAKGASRSIQNTHKCLPYDETQKDEIKKLFLRQSGTRFSNDGSNYIDWMKYDTEAESLANNYRFYHSEFGWQSQNINHRLKYIKNEISQTENDRIKTFINQTQKDSHNLLKAYTVESNFYIKLNKDLATRHFNQDTNFGIKYFIDFFYNNPSFENLSYQGKVYRGMCITHDDFKQFNVGGKIMNKTFMSTTKDRKFAEQLTIKNLTYRELQYGENVKLCILCTYEIMNNRTGLDIQEISEYKYEKEVLIGPFTPFIITTIRQIARNYVEIDLRECEKINFQNDIDDDFDDD
ncbi:unnamed protein product [Rotaria sordida]|uniref:NAD(P)(+)--arginine ADP-ribosyltransferase n=1 Tax=Rotaria sordida TaxID=392033 RepID=A0A814DEX9_9BILA|nr:unnamed protein product [Rotaria sordida]CAF3774536.1 unnamed protein product [Rotaria sordida]